MRFASVSALVMLALATVAGEDFSREQLDFFESKIRPALVKHCYQCHSQDGDQVKGGLLLDTRDATLYGGDSGPAIVPGDLNESLLYVAMTYEDSSLEMPPKYRLDSDVIADFKTWIEMGAPDPRERERAPGESSSYSSTIDIEAGREHWAYQVPQKPTVPDGADWARRGLDGFVLSKLEESGLTPAEDADPRDLLRRLSFDLVGLPPQPRHVEAFVASYEADPEQAIADTVDRLLAMPQYGETFGRRWLDVARYAESTGKDVNAVYSEAWRYRDWVIDAFNADVPFDEFITDQLAGDLIASENDLDAANRQIATGFLAIGTKGLNDQNARQFRFDMVDEQIDTMSRAFLATSVACARCHDHKFDPIPMHDYYAMAGIFLSTDTYYGTSEAIINRRSTELIPLPNTFSSGGNDLTLAEVIDQQFQVDSLNQQFEENNNRILAARQADNEAEINRLRQAQLALRTRMGLAEGQVEMYDHDGSRLPFAMGVQDRAEPFDSQILIRGEEDNPADERAARGFLQVVKTHDEQPIPTDESGRLQLAEWVVSPENPLTARVIVNRVWLWMFGEGLVSSVDNFGTTGEAPSHPELLDYLAIRLLEHDWSIKALVREIATSRTYQMASTYDADAFLKDPENRLLWRANKRRLPAEAIRDAALVIGGQLELERPVGSVVSENGEGFVGRTLPESAINQEQTYRSVYLPIVRGLVPDSLGVFDFADPSLVAGKREVTTVPSQSLFMMNSEFIQAQAAAMARRLTVDWELRGPQLVSTAFYLAYSRPPTPEEGRKTGAYIERFLDTAKESGLSEQEARQLALTTFCQSLISSAEFRYLN
ncbi:MAG: PSD1 and planctomycete cytochrome C domain-containing protein [Verrucomicrobiota bacterium]